MPLTLSNFSFPIWIILVAISTLSIVFLLNPPDIKDFPNPIRIHSISGDEGQRTTFDFKGKWYPPRQTSIEDLDDVINGQGVFGLVFENGGQKRGPGSKRQGDEHGYEGWNWCNMPHVNPDTYIRPDSKYTLEYVEVIHRHHKRTPYAANLFPNSPQPWSCSDTSIFAYSAASNPPPPTFYSPYSNPSNPFSSGDNVTCIYPQITAGGLEDSRRHGEDLRRVYNDMLSFLPPDPSDVTFRVTNNPITAHIASNVIAGLYPNNQTPVPLRLEPPSADSLEPTYPCPVVSTLEEQFGVGSANKNWTAHLEASIGIFQKLDQISGLSPSDQAWHQSYDHYFDNLSARLCHSLSLPCAERHDESCVDQTLADTVFRLGQHEYSYLYRDSSQSLYANTARFGAWIAELTSNILSATQAASDKVVYRHNVAHDGSMAALLSILQVDVMIWPGMGAEVVFEVWSSTSSQWNPLGLRHGGEAEGGKKGHKEWFIRVLWGGQPLQSSHRNLGTIDMIPLDNILKYFQELVGDDGKDLLALCGS